MQKHPPEVFHKKGVLKNFALFHRKKPVLECLLYSFKKGALKNFAKFTEEHLCQRLFFNKVAGIRLGLQLY